MVIKQHKNQFAATLLILLSLISSSSLARPLNDISQLAEASNIALLSDRVTPEEKEGHMPVVWGRGGGKSYGTLILNMLPKGKVPSSGPSRRINNLVPPSGPSKRINNLNS